MTNRRNFIRLATTTPLILLSSHLCAMGRMHGGATSRMGSSSATGTGTASDAGLLPVTALPANQPVKALTPISYAEKRDGLVRATLTAAPARLEIAPGLTTEAWAYNGQMPGPLIEAYEGDTVEIRLINKLPQATTAHWHGLLVPPDQDGNPYDPVAAGAERVYRFTLPAGSAGTYWYHPHPHGDTAEQVFRGLAGALIVRAKNDPLGALPERHLLISDLRLAADGSIPANSATDWMNGREGQFALVNGQRQPGILLDGPHRLRIWNACNARYLRLAIPEHPLIVVGSDGGLLEKAYRADELLLTPGERAEIVLVGDGNASLVARAYDRQKMGMGMSRAAPETDLTLATFRLRAGKPFILPDKLRTIADPGPVTARKRLVFSERMGMMGGNGGNGMMTFLIDGKTFDMKRVDLTSRRNEVEQWKIVNDSHMDHPFHLHGTQFIVLARERNGKATAEPFIALKDTVNLRPYETIRIKTVQRDAGMRVYHCHILEHESNGMMGGLKVV